MRVLVAFEDGYRSYRETIAAAIEILRPRLEVGSAALAELEAELARFEPHVVVCSRSSSTVDLAGSAATTWIKLSTDNPLQPTEIFYPDGRHQETRELVLDEIIGVLDEAEKHLPHERSSQTDHLVRLTKPGGG